MTENDLVMIDALLERFPTLKVEELSGYVMRKGTLADRCLTSSTDPAIAGDAIISVRDMVGYTLSDKMFNRLIADDGAHLEGWSQNWVSI